MATKQVKLTVVSDLACPWCYIGQRELVAAVEEVKEIHPQISFVLEHRPFVLNGHLKQSESVDMTEYLNSKFGPEKYKLMQERINQRGTDCGIDFKEGEGRLALNTTQAHRLLLKAWNMGGECSQQLLLEALFKAYFEDVQNIADFDVLASVAEESELMSKAEALEYLNSDEDLQTIEELVATTRSSGVTGVPLVVIDGKWAISGGQTKDIYLQIFNKMAKCCAKLNPTAVSGTDPTAICGGSPPKSDPTTVCGVQEATNNTVPILTI